MQHFPSQPIDMFGGVPLSRADVQIFTSNNLNVNWQTWRKPRGISMLYLITVCGGGGGGGGFTRSANAAGGGGAGGACSGIARLIMPAFFVPDVLYVQVGLGGLGGAASGAGGNGSNTFISNGHLSGNPNVICAGGANAPGGGGAGTGAAGGTGGTVPTNAGTSLFSSLGFLQLNLGIVGAAGGAQTGAVGTSVTAFAALPLSPGGGGAGCTTTDFAGGGQTASATIDWGNIGFATTAGLLAPGGTAAGGNGNPGLSLFKPLVFCGGSGGGSNNSGTAGNGGKGGFGCGGGGGGAGTTGGTGGDGGNGFAMIISW